MDRNSLYNLNWEHLRRQQIFKRGIMNIDEEYVQGQFKEELRGFADLPSFSAVKIS